MRKNGLRLILFLSIGLGLHELQAQSMYVKENTGTQTSYSLSTISKLSFSSENLIISQTDSSSVTYTLSSLRYLSFSDSIPVDIEAEKIINHVIRMYPNPVYRELKIDLSGTSCPGGTLNIFNLEGKLLKTQQISDSGIISVDMSHLHKGTYICHFSNGVETKSTIIYKR